MGSQVQRWRRAQYTTGSKANGIERGSYATVQGVDAKTNIITVQRQGGEVVSYDPKRLKGVNVYQEVQREIAAGERVQFTTSHKGLGVANRDLGTVTKVEPHQITVRTDGKEERSVTFDPWEVRHFDHGYAVTSHSSQGLTTGRVIANMDGETARSLINTRLAYVAISRASEDARIYTNDAATIGQRLATEITKTAAVEFRTQRSDSTRLPRSSGTMLLWVRPWSQKMLCSSNGRVKPEPSRRTSTPRPGEISTSTARGPVLQPGQKADQPGSGARSRDAGGTCSLPKRI